VNLTALSGAATVALASAVIFLAVVRSFAALSRSVSTSRFPHSIMLEAAQRFRDDIERLSRDQSVYLATALMFAVIFSITYVLPLDDLFAGTPVWLLVIELVVLVIAGLFVLYRVARIIVERRRLVFLRDANIATGHSLQRLATNGNRVFHDVATGKDVIDHVIVGLQGVYTVSVVARKPGRDNRARLKADQLLFAPGPAKVSVARCGRKSDLLASELKNVVGHKIHVRSVVVVPGWEIDHQASSEYLLVNERNIAMLTGWKDQREYLMNEEVDAIHEELTRRCKRFRG